MATRGKVADVALAALVLAILATMIVPLPTALLDVLLAFNIALGVVLLLVSLYLRSGLELSSFPTILLVTTLFRLSLNVASTRLVLLQADAGEVIRAFGEFVVRGNYVVGGVIFALLTLIQFLVIAKGSERVAEVGARFTLDALPGRQMAIDAELRSGALDAVTARARRRELARESQFYGAMDGAMKFVKGDAIAGIVITVVNLLGGLLVGVFLHDQSAGESLRTYGLLTIGDGLVSQIPALLISTSAGLVVTRVASESADSSLGLDVGAQVFGQPKALTVAGVFLLLLACVPGLPFTPFALLGTLASILGFRLARTERPSTPTGPAPPTSGDRPFVPVITPLILDVPGADEARLRALALACEAARDSVFADLGLPLPRAELRAVAASAPARVLVHELPFDVADPTDEGFVETLRGAVALRADDLLGLQETQELLDRLEKVYPAAVKNVVPKPVGVPVLAEVLRRLVAEGVNIRGLREVLEALATHAPNERDPVELAELVRGSMRRQLVRPLTQGGTLAGHLLDPSVEEVVRDAIRRTPTGAYLALPPALGRDIVEATRLAVEREGCPIVVCQSDVRRFVRRLLEHELPTVRVLSYAELPPDLVVNPVGRIVVGA